MRALRVVGILEQDGEFSVVLEDADRRERYTVPADEKLRAAARGDLTRLGQIAVEVESQLRPREIQARIRAGASVEQVAAMAGVALQKIERFAYPVLLERSRTADVAQRAHPVRADGPDPRMLGDVVAHTFGLRGQEYADFEWDAWKGEDGKWVACLSWHAGHSDIRAHWTFQPGANGGTVTAIDENAFDLVEGLPARPLRPVGRSSTWPPAPTTPVPAPCPSCAPPPLRGPTGAAPSPPTRPTTDRPPAPPPSRAAPSRRPSARPRRRRVPSRSRASRARPRATRVPPARPSAPPHAR
jgi:hypothetical protein